jgi:hypothetical protein
MIATCSIHGLQAFLRISPDLLTTSGDCQPLLIDLISDRVECSVIVSPAFAANHGIDGPTLDFKDVFVYSDWFPKLSYICTKYRSQRWPDLKSQSERDGSKIAMSKST